jgi:hypothetical protein
MNLAIDILFALVATYAAIISTLAFFKRPPYVSKPAPRREFVHCRACHGTGNSKYGFGAHETSYNSPCIMCDGKGKVLVDY